MSTTEVVTRREGDFADAFPTSDWSRSAFIAVHLRGRRTCAVPAYEVTTSLRDGAEVLSQTSAWPFHLSHLPSTTVHDGLCLLLVPLWVMPGHQPPRCSMGIEANAP